MGSTFGATAKATLQRQGLWQAWVDVHGEWGGSCNETVAKDTGEVARGKSVEVLNAPGAGGVSDEEWLPLVAQPDRVLPEGSW